MSVRWLVLAVLAGCGAEEPVPVDTSDYGPVCDCANTPPYPSAELVYANVRCMGSSDGGGLWSATAYWNGTPYFFEGFSAGIRLHLLNADGGEAHYLVETDLVPDGAEFGGRVERSIGSETDFDCGENRPTTWAVEIHDRCWAFGARANDPEWLERQSPYLLVDCVPFTPGWQ